jgi:tripartite-type tricarboxylate transporter receptor subunit TctC
MKVATRFVIASLVTCAAGVIHAGEIKYPTRPIRLITPFAPGGPSDTLARLLSVKLNEPLGQPVIVDNRPAAAGIVGFEVAAKSAPDGYTLLLGSNGGLTMNPSLYTKLPYDPKRDYQPITQLESGPQILVVHPSVPAKSVQELIALAKSKPGQINFASAGTTNRISAELFKSQAGIDIVNVAYKGTGQALTELVGGQVQMMMMSALTAIPAIKSGKLRALGVSSLKRAAVLPDIPTIAESGLPGFESTSWHGVLAPSHTPRPIVTRLHSEIVKVLAQQDVKERLASLGFEVVASTPEQFAAFIREQTAKYEKLIKQIGLKAE